MSFLWRKQHPLMGAISRPISEKVGESIDSKVASLSSPHA